MIGKSAASWQQVGNGAAEAAGDEKRSSGGQKRAFRTLSFCSFCFDVSSFPPCFYVIPTLSLPFSVFSAFLLPGKDDAGGVKRIRIYSRGDAIRTTPSYPENVTGFFFRNYTQEYELLDTSDGNKERN